MISFRSVIFVVALGLTTIPCPSHSAEPWQVILVNYCLDCHDAEVQKGDLNLEALLDAKVSAHTGDWERILRRIDAPAHRPGIPAGKFQTLLRHHRSH